MIKSIDEVQLLVTMEERLDVKTLEIVLMNFESSDILKYSEFGNVF